MLIWILKIFFEGFVIAERKEKLSGFLKRLILRRSGWRQIERQLIFDWRLNATNQIRLVCSRDLHNDDILTARGRNILRARARRIRNDEAKQNLSPAIYLCLRFLEYYGQLGAFYVQVSSKLYGSAAAVSWAVMSKLFVSLLKFA